MSQMEYETTFTKVDEEKRLVFGWSYVAQDETGEVLIDKQGDFIDEPEELEKAAYGYVVDSRRGDVMHAKRDVATLVESIVFTPEKAESMGIPEGTIPRNAWWTGYFVKDDHTWDLVKQGKLKGFSMGGKGTREKVDA